MTIPCRPLSFATAACAIALVTACGDRPAGAAAAADLTGAPCRFSPASASLAVDSAVTFLAAPGCGSLPRKGELSWEGGASPARAGLIFLKSTSCGTTTVTGRRIWKVVRCAPGPVRLTIYADTTGTTVLQQIEITDP